MMPVLWAALAWLANESPAIARLEVEPRDERVDLFWSPTAGPQAALVWRTGASLPRRVPGHPDGFGYLCTAPCRVELPPGPHRMGLADHRDEPSWIRGLEVPPGDARLDAAYRSRREFRFAGGLLIAAAIAAGAIVGLNSENECEPDPVILPGGEMVPRCKTVFPGLGRGLLIAGIGIVLGTPLLFVPDRGALTLRPGP